MRINEERAYGDEGGRSWQPSRRTVLTGAATVGFFGGLSGTGTAQEETDEGPVRFDPEIVEVARGDVAYITIAFEETDEATLVVGSERVNYVASMDVLDGDGDGEVTVALNTAVAGWQDDHGYRAVGETDDVSDVTQETDQLDEPLDAATYQLRLSVDDEQVDVGQIVLEERETGGMMTAIAPRAALPDQNFFDVLTEREEVAQGDWAIFGVGVTGVFGTLTSWEDLQDDENGLVLEFERTPAMNRPAETVQIEDGLFGRDEENDRFFIALDTDQFEVDSTYEATFRVTEAYPYTQQAIEEVMRQENIDADDLDDDEADELRSAFEESVSSSVTVHERRIEFDTENDELRVSPGEESISGTTTVAPGTELLLTVSSTSGTSFVDSTTAEVDEDGSWEAPANFSDVESGTEFIVEVDDPSDSIEGVVE